MQHFWNEFILKANLLQITSKCVANKQIHGAYEKFNNLQKKKNLGNYLILQTHLLQRNSKLVANKQINGAY